MQKTQSYEKSFACHPKAKYWSPKNEGKPENYALNSHSKCWFDCDKCGHEFSKILKNINLANSWCPYCVVPTKNLCGNCDRCFEKSFASHPRAISWSSKNKVVPHEVALKTHKPYLFDCECGHEFSSCISDITCNNSWCPYCSKPPKKLCGDILNCISCQSKTFASIEKSKYWSPKNTKKPIEVFKSTAERFIFDCPKCNNEFESKLCHITDGAWCPNCRYKTEDLLFDKLKEIYPHIKNQVKFDWCKNIKHLPFDFVIDAKKIIIECDGEQHWVQVGKWKTPEHNRARDLYKMKCANENGYSVIRIIQEDVLKNKYDWLGELVKNIDTICNEKKVQNVYMCKNNEYNKFYV